MATPWSRRWCRLCTYASVRIPEVRILDWAWSVSLCLVCVCNASLVRATLHTRRRREARYGDERTNVYLGCLCWRPVASAVRGGAPLGAQGPCRRLARLPAREGTVRVRAVWAASDRQIDRDAPGAFGDGRGRVAPLRVRPAHAGCLHARARQRPASSEVRRSAQRIRGRGNARRRLHRRCGVSLGRDGSLRQRT